ncbi:MAG TPA: excalibur calcium-binding domain-containing protein [Mycobacteriales bacterium]|nr:excalibur calcium-binding domain-containing protein [Mycobacteriales bacterium]
MRWLRTRPWPVWAAAGAVFVLFAGLGAVTRTPAVPVAADAPGLADGLERGGGAAAAPAVTTPAAVDRYPGVGPARRVPGPAGTAMPTPSASVAFFPDCTAVDAAGIGPIPRGRPGYRPALDRDGDGIACDTPAPTTAPPAPGPPTPSATPTPTPEPTVEPTPTDTPSPTPEPTATPTVPIDG